jgi:hypothetical protein
LVVIKYFPTINNTIINSSQQNNKLKQYALTVGKRVVAEVVGKRVVALGAGVGGASGLGRGEGISGEGASGLGRGEGASGEGASGVGASGLGGGEGAA